MQLQLGHMTVEPRSHSFSRGCCANFMFQPPGITKPGIHANFRSNFRFDFF
jgi:hypothetical protein